MKTFKEKSIHVNQEAVYWWTILDIQGKKTSKYGKDKKKCPVSKCTYDSLYIKRQNEIFQIYTIILNYNDIMGQPVWRTRQFHAIKES